ncbi:LamG-like jellyroll fold domain-containing protein [Paenibacillus radicis (ex Gao et al. 2016)]|uniref:LamG domain-containing protein n=1 Tax=Paenibacillus radicis (ex Gao et al. 2016) TaxID=1737354 RepID=A0A917HMX9_9BACL|nr:LamG-like jellyroll fold domain-containing protein [Paenibacillus radicis (ex Gao et al. 2016)]GGG84019.1 hypothetical protein GCM10010918_47210 [Paenibacillus radicis (ex Gao et al. 2016)]
MFSKKLIFLFSTVLICMFIVISVPSAWAETSKSIKTGDKYIYNDNGFLEYIHLRNGKFLSNSYDNNGNTISKRILEMEPKQSLLINGDKVIQLPNLNVNKDVNGMNTVEFWMMWDGTEVVMPFAWNPGYSLYFAYGSFGFSVFNGDIFGVPSNLLKDKWVHVNAVFYNGSLENCELYLDGIKQDLKWMTTKGNGTGNITNFANVGGYVGADNINRYLFKGKLANVRIWNGKRTQAQIQEHMYKPVKRSEVQPIGEWYVWDTPNMSLTYTGNNVTKLSNLPTNRAVGGKNTVEFWMKWDGKEVEMPFAWNPGYNLYFLDGYFGFNTFSGEILGVSSTDLKNKWVHITAVFYNGKLDPVYNELYIDGEKQELKWLAGTKKAEALVTDKANVGGYVGVDKEYYQFHGTIANLRIWNYGLTKEQIKAYPFRTILPQEDGLIGEWRLSDSPEVFYNYDGTKTNSYRNILANGAPGSKNTVEFWMNWDGKEMVVPFGWNPGYNLYFINGYFGFNTFNGDVLSVPSASLKNRWAHVTAIFYNGTLGPLNNELYIDGVKQELKWRYGVNNGTANVTNTVNFGGYEGADKDYYQFSGKLANLRIWNIALTPEQIQNNRYKTLKSSENGLIGEWNVRNTQFDLKSTLNN